jgi:hypothetical protein
MHKEDSLSDSEITAKLLEFMLRNRKELKFVFKELEKYRMLKARVVVLEYKDLKHFEQVHGKLFVYLLEELDKLMGGSDERSDPEEIQFK